MTNYRDHPGGSDIFMEYAGDDANTAFEDVGHSLDAREDMKALVIGKVKMNESTTTNKSGVSVNSDESLSLGVMAPLVLIVGAICAYVAMKTGYM